MKKKDDFDKYIDRVLVKDPSLADEFAKIDQAIDIGIQIYRLRKKSGLTQAGLAKLVGTAQSNIARIEDADYTGYTLKTLEKVTKALQAKIEIRIVPGENRV